MPFTDVSRDTSHWGEVFNGDLPCGEDISLDPEFELLSDEIGKDKSLHGDQKTDWVVAYRLADSLLTRSKDLWSFAYGIVAAYHTRTAKDCAACIHSLTGLLPTQWQALHPSIKRPKRRVAPLKWMCDKFHSIADNTAFLHLSPTEISELNTAFAGLQDAIDSLLPDNELSFSSILRAQLGSTAPVSSKIDDVRPASRAPARQAGHEPQPIRTTLGEIEKSSIIPSAALPQVIRTINENARQLGDHLLAINPQDERAYQLHRVATWSTLIQLPPSEANGLTQLSCPVPTNLIDLYNAGVNEKRYSEILPQVERSASKAPFWFDGQHLIVKCLEGLSATLPANSIKHSLAQLVKRFPDILTLKFRDTRPFASPKTLTWIDSFLPVVLGNSPFGALGHAPGGVSAEPDEAKRLQDAIALSLENDFKSGLEVLGKVPPGKSRAFFRHCILKAKYCSASGQPRAAELVLISLIDKLKLWDLLDWEPELTAEAVSLLLSLSRQNREHDEELQSILHTISLDNCLCGFSRE